MSTQRLTRAIGRPVVRVTPFAGRGFTPALRLIVELSDGTTVFAKQAVNEYTAGALRAEHRNLQQLRGSFAPALLGWDDDGVEPVLVLEDLSWAHWPPPWRPELVARVLDTIAEIGRHPIPDGVEPLNAEGGPPPEEVTRVEPDLAAVVAGFFARQAGLPPVPGGPGVRAIQRTQLEVALPWAIRALGLGA